MENTVTLHTIRPGGFFFLIAEKDVDTFLPEAVQTWNLRHKEWTVGDLIETGRQIAASGLLSAQGTDRTALDAARGRFVADRILLDPPVADVPIPVLAEFGRAIYFGSQVSDEEINALKKPSATTTVAT